TQADDASGIHFSAGNGKSRLGLGSSPSLVSVSGTLSRVNTVASALKRLLSRDESRPSSATPSDDPGKYRFPNSASTASLTGANVGSSAVKPAGSMRITQQVIEEVDEQATITSTRPHDTRPNVKDIFSPTTGDPQQQPGGQPLQPPPPASRPGELPARSQPVDIPRRSPQYERAYSQYEPTASLFPPGGVDALLSTSAPAGDGPSLLAGDTAPSSPQGDSSKSLFEPNRAASRETASERPDAPQYFRWFVTPVENLDVKASADVLANTAAEPPPDAGDDFEKLRAAREKEKLVRQQMNLARTISTAPGVDASGVPVVVPVALVAPPAAQPAAPTPLRTVPSNADLLAGTDPVTNSTIKSEDATTGS
ncbi:protein PRRC2A-like, partial [Drosophila navojoa]